MPVDITRTLERVVIPFAVATTLTDVGIVPAETTVVIRPFASVVANGGVSVSPPTAAPLAKDKFTKAPVNVFPAVS